MNRFSTFFKNNNLTANIILTVLSTFITELILSFLENIITPIIDINNDNKPDSQNLKELTIKTKKGQNIKIGSFIISFIKFLVVLLLISIIIYISK